MKSTGANAPREKRQNLFFPIYVTEHIRELDESYRLQGWRKNGIFPDFIASHTSTADKTDFDKVFVVETKGIHLKNEDTDYKQKIFKLCNRLAEEKSWTELGLEFPERKIVFELVFGDEWQKRLNTMFAG